MIPHVCMYRCVVFWFNTYFQVEKTKHTTYMMWNKMRKAGSIVLELVGNQPCIVQTATIYMEYKSLIFLRDIAFVCMCQV